MELYWVELKGTSCVCWEWALEKALWCMGLTLELDILFIQSRPQKGAFPHFFPFPIALARLTSGTKLNRSNLVD